MLTAAYKEFEEQVNVVRDNRGSKTAWVQEAIKHVPNEFEVREVVQACPGVSRPMIRAVMDSLREQGKIGVLGTGRGAKWQKVIITDKRDKKRDNKKTAKDKRI